MIDEKKLIEDIVNTPSEGCDKFTAWVFQNGYQCGCATRQNEIIDIINEQPKTDWIPCEERLPEDETLMYWTTHEDESIVMHGYSKRHGFIYNWEVDDLEKRKRQGNVVAWMPIFKPQPYKKEGAE